MKDARDGKHALCRVYTLRPREAGCPPNRPPKHSAQVEALAKEGCHSTFLINRAPKKSRLLKTHFVATKKLTRAAHKISVIGRLPAIIAA